MLKLLGHGHIPIDSQKSSYFCTVPKGITVVNLKMPGRELLMSEVFEFFQYLKDNKDLFTDGNIEDSITDVLIDIKEKCFELAITREGEKLQVLGHNFNKSDSNTNGDFTLGFHYMNTTLSYHSNKTYQINTDESATVKDIERTIVNSVKIGSITNTNILLRSIYDVLQLHNYKKTFVLFIFSCQSLSCMGSLDINVFSRYTRILNTITNKSYGDIIKYRRYYHIEKGILMVETDESKFMNAKLIESINRIYKYVNKRFKYDNEKKRDVFVIYNKDDLIAGLQKEENGYNVVANKIKIATLNNEKNKNIGGPLFSDKQQTDTKKILITSLPFHVPIIKPEYSYKILHEFIEEKEKNNYSYIFSNVYVGNHKYEKLLESLNYKNLLKDDGKPYIIKELNKPNNPNRAYSIYIKYIGEPGDEPPKKKAKK
jgi:hypothetical protein